MARSRRGSGKDVLGPRALNRATLARQMLLERAEMPTLEAIEHLVGMQAQSSQAPYYGLWTRLRDFRPEELSGLIANRKAVRLTVMRGTVHLVSARDSLFLRPLIQPFLDRALKSSAFGKNIAGIDLAALIEAGRTHLDETSRTLAELRKLLHARWPDHDATSLAYAVHFSAPLVQIPPRGLWGRSGLPKCTTVEAWLGKPLLRAPSAEKMVLRYLAAFGPASVADVQAWSGLTKLGAVMDKLRPKLRTFAGEDSRELFDLPDAPRPDPEVPAPVRFLPEYDNVTLGFANRSRIINQTPPKPMPDNVTARPFLVDGFVAGFWRIARGKKGAPLQIEPFGKLRKKDMTALEEEGRRLLRFAADDAEKQDVRFTEFGETISS